MLNKPIISRPLSAEISRRKFLRKIALGTSALTVFPILSCRGFPWDKPVGPARWEFPLNNDWLFGGKFPDGATQPAFDDSAFENISLPHCVAKLSWHGWRFSDWSDVWIYRKHFSLPKDARSGRVFLHFDGVTTSATPFINGHALPQRVGGYLPFQYEITELLAKNENLLAVAIDARWANAPPQGSPRGEGAVDFFEPGGITRAVSLRVTPQIFIRDVFARPLDVLDTNNRRVEIACFIDAAIVLGQSTRLKIELFAAKKKIQETTREFKIENPGETTLNLTLSNLPNIQLWDVDAPQLYEIVATLILDDVPVHDFRTRIGFREARFEPNGFFLNGRRLQIFGLNRHELFPDFGFAASNRAMRRDAEILRRELNCNAVRCSHYPQSPAFLDACDELGLLVWEEVPGWSYIGNADWQDLLVRDTSEMIIRDRNRPSVIIWGVRVNESNDNPELYRRTKALAKKLDGTRPASGAMVGGGPERHSTKHWAEDVFAYNDYHHIAPDFDVLLEPPLPGVPYLITEAVGQIVGPPKIDHKYHRAGDPFLQSRQAIYHAQAHDQAAGDERYAGVIAWCGFEYGSPMNSYNGIKCPGVVDFFRIPKLGASFYQSQVDPKIKPVIQPNFYWDFSALTPQGPGKNAAIFSNCERLEAFLNGKLLAALQPASAKFPHLKYPPFFCDLEIENAKKPELRIDGFIGNARVLSKSFSSNPVQDQFLLQTDDTELTADGIDATRLVFGVVDKFGMPRAFAGGEISFQVDGPVRVIGDNPFNLTDAGGLGAVWIKTLQGTSGRGKITAVHSVLGSKSVEVLTINRAA
jgi:beta-galactosidase